MAKRKSFTDSLKEITEVPIIEIPTHNTLYVPILKGKAGEINALKELDIQIRSHITPLVEIPPKTFDYKENKYRKSTEKHIKDVITKIEEACIIDYPFYIDNCLIEEDKMEGRFIMDYVLTNLKKNGYEVIPVVRLSDSKDLRKIIKNSISEINRVCLRISLDDLDKNDMDVDIKNLLNDIGITEKETDVLLDFKYFEASQEAMMRTLVKMTIASFPNISNYRTLITALSSFPINLADFPINSQSRIKRSDWNVWNDLCQLDNLKRKPIFSDYAIANPEMTEIDPRFMTMSASIRYTIEDEWLILKGRGVTKFGFEQFYSLSKDLIDSKYFYGKNFSWGDKMIEKKSRKEGGTGSATTWREIANNHHFTLVIKRLTSS